MMSCRLPWKVCRHRWLRVSTAACPRDTAGVGADCLEVVGLLGGGGSVLMPRGWGGGPARYAGGHKSFGPLVWEKGPI